MSSAWHQSGFLWLVAATAATVNGVPLAHTAAAEQLTILAQRSFIDDPLISCGEVAGKPADLLVVRNSETAYPLVIRSAQELAAVSPQSRSAQHAAAAEDDAKLQIEVEQRLLTLLELAEINWEKQMVVALLANGSYRRPPRWEFSLQADADALVVHVRSHDGEFGCGRPWSIAVIERFDGKVEFRGQSTR